LTATHYAKFRTTNPVVFSVSILHRLATRTFLPPFAEQPVRLKVSLKTLLVAVAMSWTARASAQTVDLNPIGWTEALCNCVGDGDRNTAFQMLQTVNMSTAGIHLQHLVPGAFTLNAYLYTMTSPTSSRTLVASNSVTFSSSTLDWFNVPVAYTLVNGGIYDLGFTASDGFGFGKYDVEFFQGFDGPPSPNAANQVSIIDGGYSGSQAPSADPGFSNFWTPHLAINENVESTPEPASFILIGSGLIAIAAVRGRRNRVT
jgi:hypothetical protein